MRGRSIEFEGKKIGPKLPTHVDFLGRSAECSKLHVNS